MTSHVPDGALRLCQDRLNWGEDAKVSAPAQHDSANRRQSVTPPACARATGLSHFRPPPLSLIFGYRSRSRSTCTCVLCEARGGGNKVAWPPRPGGCRLSSRRFPPPLGPDCLGLECSLWGACRQPRRGMPSFLLGASYTPTGKLASYQC
jgi:hypothetical protein